MLKQFLGSPAVYQMFQQAGGFFGARLKSIEEFLDVKPGQRIIDIGCGPGYIVKYLPENIDYIGFDIDQAYIDHANKEFGKRGRFFCRYFNSTAAEEFAPADIVMMNGVLHHIPDEELIATLGNISKVLAPGGKLFTLDGCYHPGQTRFQKWMLDNDRGQYVRDEVGYRQLLSKVFSDVSLNLRDNYSRVPYSFVIGIASN